MFPQLGATPLAGANTAVLWIRVRGHRAFHPLPRRSPQHLLCPLITSPGILLLHCAVCSFTTSLEQPAFSGCPSSCMHLTYGPFPCQQTLMADSVIHPSDTFLSHKAHFFGLLVGSPVVGLQPPGEVSRCHLKPALYAD